MNMWCNEHGEHDVTGIHLVWLHFKVKKKNEKKETNGHFDEDYHLVHIMNQF